MAKKAFLKCATHLPPSQLFSAPSHSTSTSLSTSSTTSFSTSSFTTPALPPPGSTNCLPPFSPKLLPCSPPPPLPRPPPIHPPLSPPHHPLPPLLCSPYALNSLSLHYLRHDVALMNKLVQNTKSLSCAL